MKIVFLIDSLALGGAQKHLCQMAVGLAARGHRVQVVGLNDVSHLAMLEPLAAAGIRITVIGRLAILSGMGLFRLWRLVRADRPDILVTILFASTVAGRVATMFVRNIRVVTCVQARNINYSGWQFALLRLTAGRTDRFFFNSRSAMPFGRAQEGASAERSHFVPNGIETRGESCAFKNAKWADFGLPFQLGDEVIGTIGRLDPQKGFADLLRGFAQIVQQRSQARLLVVGGGPLERELRGLAAELGVAPRVVFAGERADGAALIALAKLYVQPSIFEGTPNALMEAMAAGVPSIASAVDGAQEIITHGVNGWLVPPSTPVMLARAILAVLEDSVQMAVVARRGQQTILDGFALDRMIDDYERHFFELLGCTSPTGADKSVTMR